MRKKYKFTDKNQSRWGILSDILGALALLLTVLAFSSAYRSLGQSGKGVAILGFLGLLLAAAGLFYGIRGSREEDTYHLLPYLGTAVNGLLLLSYLMIYIIGW